MNDVRLYNYPVGPLQINDMIADVRYPDLKKGN